MKKPKQQDSEQPLESWLRKEVGPAYDALKADPSRAVTADQVRSRLKVSDLPEFDAAPYLVEKEALAAFVNDLLQGHEIELLLSTLGDLARARGVGDVATAAGMTPAELGEALQLGGEPSFDAVRRILSAFGLQIVCRPAGHV